MTSQKTCTTGAHSIPAYKQIGTSYIISDDDTNLMSDICLYDSMLCSSELQGYS